MFGTGPLCFPSKLLIFLTENHWWLHRKIDSMSIIRSSLTLRNNIEIVEILWKHQKRPNFENRIEFLVCLELKVETNFHENMFLVEFEWSSIIYYIIHKFFGRNWRKTWIFRVYAISINWYLKWIVPFGSGLKIYQSPI